MELSPLRESRTTGRKRKRGTPESGESVTHHKKHMYETLIRRALQTKYSHMKQVVSGLG